MVRESYGSRTRQRRCSPSLKNTPMYWRRKSITSCPDGHAVAVAVDTKTKCKWYGMVWYGPTTMMSDTDTDTIQYFSPANKLR